MTERVAIGKALEEEIGSRQGQRTDKGKGELPVDLPEVPPGVKETRDIAAKAAGFGSEATYRHSPLVGARRRSPSMALAPPVLCPCAIG